MARRSAARTRRPTVERGTFGGMLAALALLLAMPASAQALGELTQKADPAGCIVEGTAGGRCKDSNGVADTDAAVSADGENVYTVSFETHKLAILDRDPATGELTQKAGTAGCIRDGAAGEGCQGATALIKPAGVAVSSDGKSVYATSYDRFAILVFDRDTDTGELEQKDGTAGCVSEDSAYFTGGACADGHGIGRPDRIVVSPNGLNVYVVTWDSVVIFDRDPDTGELEQKDGTAGCISDNGTSGTCQVGRGLEAANAEGIAISPDGRSVYANSRSDLVTIFDRDITNGELTQKPGTAGCVSEDGSSDDGPFTCQDGRALQSGSVKSPVVSADNHHVYVPASASNAVAIFDRAPTGELTQKAGTAGCISEDGTGGECLQGRGLMNALDTAVSADGKSVYAGGANAVAVLDRSPDSGELTQKPDTVGCVSQTNPECQTAFGNGAIGGAPTVSPDDKSLYAGVAANKGIAVFDRTVAEPPPPGGGGGPPPPPPDGDGDGIPDTSDNCPATANTDQANADGDAQGNACDADDDNDGVPDAADKCPVQPADGADGCPALFVAAASPRQGGAGGATTITLSGFGLTGEPTVTLKRKGLPDIVGTDVRTTPGARGFSARLNLQGAKLTRYDLVVGRRGSSASVSFARGFTVQERVPPTIGAEVLGGRAALGNYPTRAVVKVTNYGNVDATNALVRVDGFQSGADVDVSGPGVSALPVESGADHGMVVAFDRVPALGTKAAFVRFTPVGPAHALYRVRTQVLSHTVPPGDVGPAANPALRLAREVVKRTDTEESGVLNLTGGGTLSYSLAFKPGSKATPASVEGGRSGATVRHQFTASLPKPGTAPPSGRPQDVTGDLTMTISGSVSTIQGLRAVRDGTGGNATTAQRRHIADCLRARSYISRAQHATLDDLADGGQTIAAVLAGLGDQEADAVLSGQFDVFAGLVVNAWDTALIEYLEAAASRDPSNPFFKRPAEEINGAVLELCRAPFLPETEEWERWPDVDPIDLTFTPDPEPPPVCQSKQPEDFSDVKIDWSGTLLEEGLEPVIEEMMRALERGDRDTVRRLAKKYQALSFFLDDDWTFPPPTPPAPAPSVGPMLVWPMFCDPPPPPPDFTWIVEVIFPADPNDKVGPRGSGKGHFIAPGAPMTYLVMFENKPDAGAPAHEVTITDRLDRTKLDLQTVELGPVYFGTDKFAVPPPGVRNWTDTIDLRPAKNLVVAISAGLDLESGVLTWRFRGLNPDTGELETAPELGFLPPDKAPPEGQGGVTFTVAQRSGLKTGAQIANGASIVFDRNEPILTPTYVNRIDSSVPSSAIRSARARGRSCRTLKVAFAGSDTGSGIASRDVYVSRNGTKYRPWRLGTRRKSDTYRALADGAYSFFSIAADGVGHREAATGGLWDAIVVSARKRGNRLVITLRKSAVKRLKITSLRVRVNGRPKGRASKRVPSRITVNGLRSGGSAIGLVARAKLGRRTTNLRDTRIVAMCPRVRAGK